MRRGTSGLWSVFTHNIVAAPLTHLSQSIGDPFSIYAYLHSLGVSAIEIEYDRGLQL